MKLKENLGDLHWIAEDMEIVEIEEKGFRICASVV